MDVSPNYQGPGLYRHYKGGMYDVLGLALQESTVVKPDEGPKPGHTKADERTFVIYRPLTTGSLLETRPEGFWARDLDDFNAWVKPTGSSEYTDSEPRFTREDR